MIIVQLFEFVCPPPTLTPTAQTSDIIGPSLVRNGTYCQGSLVVSNVHAHTNGNAINRVRLKLGMALCNSHVIKHYPLIDQSK